MLASIVIRTLNEEQYLEELLISIKEQNTSLETEIIVVDSGSTDKTLMIAKKHNCNVVHISKNEFSFGKSLNLGCDAAKGEILIFISGHCVPCHGNWLQNLCQSLIEGKAQYSYGKQIAGEKTYFSEKRIFAKYYPNQSQIPQEGYFCNNANSAILKTTWQQFKFDEEITGLEDMELASRLVEKKSKIAYVAEAEVFHYHEEAWPQVKRRFEREALALQKIMPQVQIRTRDLVKYITISITSDLRYAIKENLPLKQYPNIIKYRFWQYWGSYTGNHEHRKLSRKQKEKYFYPITIKDEKTDETNFKYSSIATHEGK